MGRECFESLPETELHQIYQLHQQVQKLLSIFFMFIVFCTGIGSFIRVSFQTPSNTIHNQPNNYNPEQKCSCNSRAKQFLAIATSMDCFEHIISVLPNLLTCAPAVPTLPLPPGSDRAVQAGLPGAAAGEGRPLLPVQI